MEKYFQREIECAPIEEIKKIQDEKLVRQVRHAYDSVPYYKALMDKKGVKPEDIKSSEDISKLPFISKDDLRECYPFGLLAVPKSECVRLHSTSGTTGKRVIVCYTKNDIDLWEDCAARALVAAGADKDDVVQVAYGFGLFTGGAGVYGASHKVGCLTVPMSSGNTDRQIQFMQDIGTTVLCCTPSYAEYIAEVMDKEGISKENLQLKAGIFGAEPWTEEMRKNIEGYFGIKAYDIYGLTELSGPGVAYECSAQHGMHINEDHFIAEIINPETGEVLPLGEKGELVFTSLDKEAFPVIRYRTKDICVLSREKCSCGRTFIKMAKPMGRSDDMLIIRGVNVFPSQIESVLLQLGYSSNYQIVVDRIKSTDTFDVYVEMSEEHFSDTVRKITEKTKEISASLKEMLGINPAVHLVAPGSIARSEGKAVRVIDKRKLIENN